MNYRERYIQTVIKQLPSKDRAEVRLEIEAMIDDLLDAYENPTDAQINSVLLSLGHPNKMASQYLGRERYLIGPLYYDMFLMVLKIVILAILLGVSIAYFLNGIQLEASFFSWLSSYTASLLNGSLQGAIWVILIFTILERTTKPKTEAFKLEDLPETYQRRPISKGETIFSLVCSVVVLVAVVYFAPYLRLYFHSDAGWQSIPLFNLDVLEANLWLVILIFACGVIRAINQLIYPYWNPKSVGIDIVFGGLSLAFNILFFSNFALYHADFLQIYTQIQSNFPFDLSWERLVIYFLVFLTGAYLLECGNHLYQAYKNSQNNRKPQS
ncbi:MAG: hypothetical protein ACRCZJ_06975 [Erysipelotrichaceae bacterium]